DWQHRGSAVTLPDSPELPLTSFGFGWTHPMDATQEGKIPLHQQKQQQQPKAPSSFFTFKRIKPTLKETNTNPQFPTPSSFIQQQAQHHLNLVRRRFREAVLKKQEEETTEMLEAFVIEEKIDSLSSDDEEEEEKENINEKINEELLEFRLVSNPKREASRESESESDVECDEVANKKKKRLAVDGDEESDMTVHEVIDELADVCLDEI
ncbi:UNVERIFIED_CONTAM: hypothetical protein HDU68_012818, partial [Siphonaria sp. JEL0065]